MKRLAHLTEGRLTYSPYLLPLKSGWKCFSLVFTAPPLTFTVHFHFSLFFVITNHHLSITYISHQVNLIVWIFICCGSHYLCLSWSIYILKRNLFVLELKYIYILKRNLKIRHCFINCRWGHRRITTTSHKLPYGLVMDNLERKNFNEIRLSAFVFPPPASNLLRQRKEIAQYWSPSNFLFKFVIIHHHLVTSYAPTKSIFLVHIFVEYLLLWNVVFYGWGYPPEL